MFDRTLLCGKTREKDGRQKENNIDKIYKIICSELWPRDLTADSLDITSLTTCSACNNNNNNNIQMFIQGVHHAINGLTGVPVVKKS